MAASRRKGGEEENGGKGSKWGPKTKLNGWAQKNILS
jgi:hypothetical protein